MKYEIKSDVKCSFGHKMTFDKNFGWICNTCMDECAEDGYEGSD